MKKILFLSIASCAVLFVSAQKFTKTISIKMPDEGGSNGASIAWHPKLKKYFAVMAGNEDFPLVITNEKGEIQSLEGTEARVDVRGLWYNPKTKTIEGNTYDVGGWFKYILSEDGIYIYDVIPIKKGQNQPNEQSVGVADTLKRLVYFLDEAKFLAMHMDSTEVREIVSIVWSDDAELRKDISVFKDKFNSTAFAYTGLKGKEFAIWNIEDNELWFINRTNGKVAEKLKLPKDLATYSLFNFCYTNGQYFFFNKETRTWTGYKISKSTPTKPKR